MRNSVRSFNSRKIVAFAAAVILVVGASALYRTTQAAHDPVEHVREVLMQSATAFERNDIATLNKVWANDESLTVFEQGHANYGWADYRDNHLLPEMREMKNTKYMLSDIKVKVAGTTTAWATFKYAISADVDGRHVNGGGLGTAVLESRGGQWQIVHWHSSAPHRAPSAPPPAKKS